MRLFVAITGSGWFTYDADSKVDVLSQWKRVELDFQPHIITVHL